MVVVVNADVIVRLTFVAGEVIFVVVLGYNVAVLNIVARFDKVVCVVVD